MGPFGDHRATAPHRSAPHSPPSRPAPCRAPPPRAGPPGGDGKTMGKTWENEVCSVLNHLKHLETSLKPASIFEVRRNVQSQVVLSCFADFRCWKMQFEAISKAISTFNPWAFDTAPPAWHFFFSHCCEMLLRRFLKRKDRIFRVNLRAPLTLCP